MHKNYIAGEWVAGETAIENRNPSDISDLIGHYAQATTAHLERAIDAATAVVEEHQIVACAHLVRLRIWPCGQGAGGGGYR